MNYDDFKAIVKTTFIDNGFTFEEGKKYIVDQDQHYVYLSDDNGQEHALTYDKAKEVLEC